MEKCKQTRKHKYTFTLLDSMTCLPSCHLESSAMNTDTPTSGSAVNSRGWPNKRRKFMHDGNSYFWSFLDYRVHLLHRHRRTRQVHQQVHRKVQLRRSDELAPGNWSRNPSKDSKDSNDCVWDLPEWLEEFADNLEDAEMPSPAYISHDSDSEHPTKVAPIHTYFPKDQLCEVCKRTKMTRAPCRRRTGEAVPQRRRSISKQSPIRSRGTRFSHSMVSILSV